MSIKKIVQYVHRLNATELGQTGTHENYLSVSKDVDLSAIFPLGVDVDVEDIKTGKLYQLKSSTGNGSEFRINRMGELYRDYSIMPGDKVIITHFEESDNKRTLISAKTFNRVVLIIDNKGTEINNIERISGYLVGERQYSLEAEYNGVVSELTIKYTGAKKKRSDSPMDTDYYEITINGNKLSNGKYYLNLGNQNSLVEVKSKFEYNVVELEESEDLATTPRPKQQMFNHPLQQIYYGAPGTGKSRAIKDKTSEAEKDKRVFRTTFHPDSDYSTFVGCYKPGMKPTDRIYSVEELAVKLKEIKNTGVTYPCHKFAAQYWKSLKDLSGETIKQILLACGFTESMNVEISKGVAIGQEYLNKEENGKIIYTFIPQAFTNAYVKAWSTTDDVYLIIEEINRGNCAQIFGDLFQLLDRKNGVSEYAIDADADLANYICKKLENSLRSDFPSEVKEGKKLVLPSNLYIWATMNTSDQSLFPIDSAFKRRWEWKYVPINNHEDKNYKIEIGTAKYDWWGFLSKINQVIGDTTNSEDKKLGYFFAKAKGNIIEAEQFVGKVLFYLWNDVFKNYGFDNPIFSKGDNKKFEFAEFFKQDGSPDTDMVNKFLVKLNETIDNENSFDETKTASNNEEQGE